ncbi:MAG: M48 family metallopeptidase, partial [Candidatus Flemingiibacterium sp.]
HWATCSAKGGLNFTWFTVMAEPAAIDYIIIHELCHMTELNHSPRFWKLVAERCPDYKDKKKYLDSLWREILSENW